MAGSCTEASALLSSVQSVLATDPSSNGASCPDTPSSVSHDTFAQLLTVKSAMEMEREEEESGGEGKEEVDGELRYFQGKS